MNGGQPWNQGCAFCHAKTYRVELKGTLSGICFFRQNHLLKLCIHLFDKYMILEENKK